MFVLVCSQSLCHPCYRSFSFYTELHVITMKLHFTGYLWGTDFPFYKKQYVLIKVFLWVYMKLLTKVNSESDR